MSNYRNIMVEKKKLQEEIDRTIKDIDQYDFPQGKLICTKNGTRYKWYINNKGELKYLPKKKNKLAEKLALKRYFEVKLNELQIKLSASEAYLNKLSLIKYSEERLLSHPEFSRLLSHHFMSANKELLEWQNAPYASNPKFTDQLQCKGTSGKMLRSKSEVIIDMMLYSYKIPFRYESKLTLKGIDYYPDFTIRHPRTKEFYYWEHFGMMDNPIYSKKAFEKMQAYCQNGIIPSVNFITTFETKDHPLDATEVEKIIEKYFL